MAEGVRRRRLEDKNGVKDRDNFRELRSNDTVRVQELRRKAEQLRAEFLDQIDGQLNDLFEDVLQDVKEPIKNGAPAITRSDKSNGGKVFIARQSVLTELLKVSHIRTIYNIFVALLVVFVLNTIVYDFIDTGRLVFDFSIVMWAFGKVSVVINIWLVMACLALLLFPLFFLWVNSRGMWYSLPDLAWIPIYLCFLVVFAVFPLQETSQHELPTGSAIIVLAEQVRFLLKIHAFVRENVPKVISQTKPTTGTDKDQDEPAESDSTTSVQENGEDELPEFGQYLYFLFCPTLVYRNHYPMTPSIRWNYVVSNFTQVFICIFYTYYVFARFCVPVFRNTGKEPRNYKNLLLSVFSCMLPGTMVLVLGFFGILHSWLNAFAEMTRFADRMFYRDWWNSPSYADWYRSWNVVVHDWIYAYVYKDLLRVCNRQVATVGVFIASAAVHEYILACSFGFFFPVLLLLFGGIGLSFIFIKPKRRDNISQVWNVLMWITLILGNGVLMCLYSCEWYAVQNCPHKSESWLGHLVPRSWSDECVGKVTE